MDDKTARLIRELGDRISPENAAASARIYAGHHEIRAGTRHPAPDGVEVTRDYSYGAHPRNRLDVFSPYGPDGRHDREGRRSWHGWLSPVVVFLHGGNFVGGDKQLPDSPFYDNVGLWAARQGFVGVTMTYRLAPKARFPAGPEDLAAAVRWLQAEITGFGGDPACIIGVGASAGAVHVASHVARSAPGEHGLAGVVLLSGIYDLQAFSGIEVLAPYYGEGADLAQASPLDGLVASGVPVLAALAELDPPDYHRQAALLVQAVTGRAGRWPHLVYLPRHNHFTEVLHLGTDDVLLGRHLRDFVRMHAGLTTEPSINTLDTGRGVV